MPQVPTPGPDIWAQILSSKAWADYPVVFILIICFVLAGFFIRWFWLEFKHNAEQERKEAAAEAEKDRAWRESQNDKREANAAEQNKLWRDILASQFTVLKEISSYLVELRNDLQDHDERAKNIGHTINRVDENTRPQPGQPGYERRQKE